MFKTLCLGRLKIKIEDEHTKMIIYIVLHAIPCVVNNEDVEY